jgi:hypothetical protein
MPVIGGTGFLGTARLRELVALAAAVSGHLRS